MVVKVGADDFDLGPGDGLALLGVHHPAHDSTGALGPELHAQQSKESS